MRKLQSLAKSKKTTAMGTTSVLAGLIIGLVPQDVWKTCGESVAQTSNPLFVSALVIVGLALTVIGPSLAKSRS
jgi:hypothetical protein